MLNNQFSSGNNSQRSSQPSQRTSPQVKQHSYFEKNWGTASPVEKAPTREVADRLSVREASASLANQYLAKDSVSFLKAFKQKLEAKVDQHEVRDVSPNELLLLIFELLKVYAYEYNASVGLSPFHLDLMKPQAVTEIVRGQTLTFVRAKLCTTTHALILRADDNEIAFFVMPLERAWGLGAEQAQGEPNAVLRVSSQIGGFSWETKSGLPLTINRTEATARAVFQWLIERTADRLNQ